MDEIQGIVKGYILEKFLPGAGPDELKSDTPLIGTGILDSLATVRLVMFLEERFGIEVHAHEANVENLANLEAIGRLVSRKSSGGAR
jgi:acyl carrier protein